MGPWLTQQQNLGSTRYKLKQQKTEALRPSGAIGGASTLREPLPAANQHLGWLHTVFGLRARVLSCGLATELPGSWGVSNLTALGPSLENELSYRKQNPSRKLQRLARELHNSGGHPLGVSFLLKGKLT